MVLRLQGCGGCAAWGRGSGFWGVSASPEDKERSRQCPQRGQAPPRGHVHTAGKDEDSPCQQCWGWEGRGSWEVRGHRTPREVRLARPCEKGASPHPPPTLSCFPLHRDRCLLPASHGGLREVMGSVAGTGVNKVTRWVWLRTRVHRTRERCQALLENTRPCLGLLPAPGDRQDAALDGPGPGGGDSVRSTSRHTQPGSPRSTGRGGSSPRA